jgi:hypothetical protein
MKTAIAVLLTAFALFGCSSKPKPVPPPWGAIPPTMQTPQLPVDQRVNVTIQGPVRHPLIIWGPNLTLARALVEAEYLGQRDPHSIVIFRGDKAILVEIKHLLSGIKDPPLLPGDVVELRQ